MRQGPWTGRYPAAAAMVIFALVPYLALSAALGPITPIIAKDLHMSLQAMLPAAHSLVRGQPMLEEVQRPTGLEDPSQLAKRADSVGNRAQRPSGQSGVVTVVFERQRLTIQPGACHRDTCCPQAPVGQLPS